MPLKQLHNYDLFINGYQLLGSKLAAHYAPLGDATKHGCCVIIK